jgi:ribosome biogenesis protein MAK21
LTPREQHDGNSRKVAYDGRKRDPEHSNADKSCLWELVSSLRHVLFFFLLTFPRSLSSTTSTRLSPSSLHAF